MSVVTVLPRRVPCCGLAVAGRPVPGRRGRDSNQPRPASISGRGRSACVTVKGGRLRGERLCRASAERSSLQAIDEARGHCPLHNHTPANTAHQRGIPRVLHCVPRTNSRAGRQIGDCRQTSRRAVPEADKPHASLRSPCSSAGQTVITRCGPLTCGVRDTPVRYRPDDGRAAHWPRSSRERGAGKSELRKLSKAELYERATEQDLPGRSKMSRQDLIDALSRTRGSPQEDERCLTRDHAVEPARAHAQRPRPPARPAARLGRGGEVGRVPGPGLRRCRGSRQCPAKSRRSRGSAHCTPLSA
jgi:hypothetical protein